VIKNTFLNSGYAYNVTEKIYYVCTMQDTQSNSDLTKIN